MQYIDCDVHTVAYIYLAARTRASTAPKHGRPVLCGGSWVGNGAARGWEGEGRMGRGSQRGWHTNNEATSSFDSSNPYPMLFIHPTSTLPDQTTPWNSPTHPTNPLRPTTARYSWITRCEPAGALRGKLWRNTFMFPAFPVGCSRTGPSRSELRRGFHGRLMESESSRNSIDLKSPTP